MKQINNREFKLVNYIKRQIQEFLDDNGYYPLELFNEIDKAVSRFEIEYLNWAGIPR